MTENSEIPPHRVHLKGPWYYHWLTIPGQPNRTEEKSQPEQFPLTGRVKMPAAWKTLFGNVAGKVSFSRRFHSPTNLDPNEKVFIVFDGVGGASDVSVNGVSLGSFKTSKDSVGFEMTDLLQPANELVIDVEFDPAAESRQSGGLWAPVVIEIRTT